jgi:hypothetical protein
MFMSDEPASPGGKPKARRRAPTIDLTATEAAAEQQATASPGTERPEAAETASLSSAHPAHAAQPEEAAQVKPVSQNEQVAETSAQATATPSAEAESVSPSPTKSPSKLPWLFFGAGAVGAAVAAIVLLGPGLYYARNMNALVARVADLEQLRNVTAPPLPPGTDASTINDLAGRVAKLETAIANLPTSPPDPAFANRISAVEGQLKALSEMVGILERRSDEANAVAREAKQRAETTAAALAELARKLNQPVERSEVDALANRLSALERTAKALEGEITKRPPSNDQQGRLATAATALRTAVERGDPFAAELAAVKFLGADRKLTGDLDTFAASGVPSTATLARELLLIMPALRDSARVGNHGSFLEKLQANAEKLVRVRPLEETAGTDTAAILGRIEFRASQRDIAGALAELASLPAPARVPAEAWIKRAQARTTAVASSRELEANALASLSK